MQPPCTRGKISYVVMFIVLSNLLRFLQTNGPLDEDAQQVSGVQNLCWLMIIGDYNGIKLSNHGDYNNPIEESL